MAESRHCEFCVYEPCEDRKVLKRLGAEDYVRCMEEVIGTDIKGGREQEKVWARNMIAYQMVLDGYTTTVIGNVIGKARCMITYCVAKVQDMLNTPKYYPEEMHVWREFRKKILSLQQKP